MPVRILTSVDLPAPFSPISAVTSPGRKARLTLCRARTPGKRLETPDIDRIGAAGLTSCGAGAELRAAIGSIFPAMEERRAPAPPGEAQKARADNQKILANFSIFDLSKVKGSDIAAEPSSPILISPMRPAWIVVPGAPVALPSAIRAAIIVAL